MLRKVEKICDMIEIEDNSSLYAGAMSLLGDFSVNKASKIRQANWLVETCKAAQGRDVLVVHSPGGWGCADIKHLINWERSLVIGIQDALSKLGLNAVLVQYFRSGNTFWDHLTHIPEQIKYFLTGEIYQAKVMAAQVRFIYEHLHNIKIVLLGVSQGAAFNNSVMEHSDRNPNIFSIEVGTFFTQLKRRVITEQTLALDSNGLMPDPVVRRNVGAALKAYFLAPFSWAKYKFAGQSVKYTYCINVPGHDYNWNYPDVQRRISDFLKVHLFSDNVEVETRNLHISN